MEKDELPIFECIEDPRERCLTKAKLAAALVEGAQKELDRGDTLAALGLAMVGKCQVEE